MRTSTSSSDVGTCLGGAGGVLVVVLVVVEVVTFLFGVTRQ